MLLLSINLFAYVDSDMDGVDNSYDKCPNTPLTELVDIRGCTIKSTVSLHHFDIIVGASYSDADYNTLNKTKTLSSSLQVDYYYKNLSLQASTSYYKTQSSAYNNKGLNNSVIAGYYKIRAINSLYVRVGAGVILPTYNSSLKNNNTDYFASLSLSYPINSKVNLFGGYSYTIINDVPGVSYKNTNGYNGGLGYYFSSKLYASAGYNLAESSYMGVGDISTASLYAFYSIDNNWFTSVNYAYGLSTAASNNYASISLGYYF